MPTGEVRDEFAQLGPDCYQRTIYSLRIEPGCLPRLYLLEVCFLLERMSWGQLQLYIDQDLPSFDLSSFHDNWLEANVTVVIDDSIGDAAGMFNINVVSDGCGEGKSIIGYPVCWLYCWVVSYFRVCSNSHWVCKSINHCSKTYIAILSHCHVSVNGGAGSDVSRRRDSERIILDIENISVSIDGLKVGNIVSKFRSSSIEC